MGTKPSLWPYQSRERLVLWVRGSGIREEIDGTGTRNRIGLRGMALGSRTGCGH